ncbi:hypothetical protein DRO60_03285 [Candidatus Bathyarchaeota archaeon]|nr:MAG: hypothetical protein DRO60_03285 [Candidatus Bathyarchaeota archaeon]
MPILRGDRLRGTNSGLAKKRIATQLCTLAICNAGFTAALKTGLVVPFLYCHGCPLASFACPMGALQHFLGRHEAPFLVLGLLSLAFLVLGRWGCGWLCPFGALQDLLAYLAGRKPKKPKGWSGAEVALRQAKLGVLLGSLAASYLLAGTTFCWLCPVGAIFAGIPYVLLQERPVVGLFFYVHMLVLMAVLLAAMYVPRAWCRYLCPIGALAGLFNDISSLHLELDEELCVRCHACLEACPMGIADLRDLGGRDCILCGRCVSACPRGALKIALRP